MKRILSISALIFTIAFILIVTCFFIIDSSEFYQQFFGKDQPWRGYASATVIDVFGLIIAAYMAINRKHSNWLYLLLFGVFCMIVISSSLGQVSPVLDGSKTVQKQAELIQVLNLQIVDEKKNVAEMKKKNPKNALYATRQLRDSTNELKNLLWDQSNAKASDHDLVGVWGFIFFRIIGSLCCMIFSHICARYVMALLPVEKNVRVASPAICQPSVIVDNTEKIPTGKQAIGYVLDKPVKAGKPEPTPWENQIIMAYREKGSLTGACVMLGLGDGGNQRKKIKPVLKKWGEIS